jgi:hypothetical protein
VEARFIQLARTQGGVTMFATIKNLIPEPRQADQPRRYVGKHRQPEPSPVPETPTPESPTAEEVQPAAV